ncbi:MAG: LacI family DNA-binding transcriptional regulator [Bacteroidota bacterium]
MEIVTIKDIAKALNLSASTVSRALRNSYEISEPTKKIVLEYAKKYNYRPNPIALSLKENKSRSIGVLVPEIDNPFFSQAINGIESVAYAKGYHVLIFQSNESLEREVININHMISRRVDGVILSLSAETFDVPHLHELTEMGTPMVMFDRVSSEINTHKVVADNFSGAFEAVELLIKKGKKRIAFIGVSQNISISKERLIGYKAALEKHGVEFDPTIVKESGYSPENIEADIKALFSMEYPPDAILSVSDRLALTCLSVFKKQKYNIPKDFSYICFSNLKVADLFSPSITTVTQPAFEMGQKSAELLFQILNAKPKEKIEFQTLKISTTLNVRESSN